MSDGKDEIGASTPNLEYDEKAKAVELWASLRMREAQAALTLGTKLVVFASAFAPTDEAVNLRERIFSLTDPDHHFFPPQVFDGLVKAALAAFPDDVPTDEQIVSNAATPDLVRYFLAVLRDYEARNPTSDPGPGRTLNALVGPARKEKPHGQWPKISRLAEPMVAAAESAFADARREGQTRRAVNQAAIDAAYVVYREGLDDLADERNRSKDRAEIKRLLQQHKIIDFAIDERTQSKEWIQMLERYVARDAANDPIQTW